MKNLIRTTALTAAAACLSISLGIAPVTAHAASGGAVRAAQTQLASLGYVVGPQDGVMGPLTTTALMDFQSRSGLPMSGHLTSDTARLLSQASLDYRRDVYGYGYAGQPAAAYGYGYGYQGSYNPNSIRYNVTYDRAAYQAVPSWNHGWQNANRAIPVRFGKLAVNESIQGGLHHYSVELNGQPVLRADNQPAALRVSKTYTLSGTDAVIFTAYDGATNCNYKNYLMTVNSDGTYTTPREIGNCSSGYQARIDGNALFISFPNQLASGSWDNWRYSTDGLVRI